MCSITTWKIAFHSVIYTFKSSAFAAAAKFQIRNIWERDVMKNLFKLFLVGATFCLHFNLAVAEEAENKLTVYENLDLFSEVFERIRKDYVEEVDDTDLIRGAINGMLSSLDPHSGYMSTEQMEKSREETTGEFGGLGIEVTLENGFVKVVSPIDDTPAAEAGIQSGDYIIEIEGESVLGMTLNDAVKKLRGEIGSEVKITIDREDVSVPFPVTISRAVITIDAAETWLEGDAILVRIKTFNKQTRDNVLEGINEAAEELGGLENANGVILDIRNNPGGLLSSAVDVTEIFLDGGEILSVRDRGSENSSIFNAKVGDKVNGKPIVVLINGGSASASEILAGALQDHGRGIIVGTKSFGKGSVQTITPLGPKYGGLRLTTARYYTPSGRSIQAQGISPDIVVEHRIPDSLEEEEEVADSVFRSEADLQNRLENDSLVATEDLAEEEAAVKAMEELRNRDFQLAYAIDILTGLAVFGSLN